MIINVQELTSARYFGSCSRKFILLAKAATAKVPSINIRNGGLKPKL